MKTIKKYDEFLNESIVKNMSSKETDKFIMELEGKLVSFYSKGKNYTELILDIEMTPDEEIPFKLENNDKYPYYGKIWFNEKEVDLSKEIIIK